MVNSRTYDDVEITTTNNDYVSPFSAHGYIEYDATKAISCLIVQTEGANTTRFGVAYFPGNNILCLVTNVPGTYKVRIFHN